MKTIGLGLVFGVLMQVPAYGATFYCVASCYTTVRGAFLSTNGTEYTVDDCTGGLGQGKTALIYSQTDSMETAVDSLQTQCNSQADALAEQFDGTTYDVPQEGDIYRLDENGNGYLWGHEDGVSCTAGYTGQTSAALSSGSGAKPFSPIDDCKMAP